MDSNFKNISSGLSEAGHDVPRENRRGGGGEESSTAICLEVVPPLQREGVLGQDLQGQRADNAYSKKAACLRK